VNVRRVCFHLLVVSYALKVCFALSCQLSVTDSRCMRLDDVCLKELSVRRGRRKLRYLNNGTEEDLQRVNHRARRVQNYFGYYRTYRVFHYTSHLNSYRTVINEKDSTVQAECRSYACSMSITDDQIRTRGKEQLTDHSLQGYTG
jgi:hypothetical protein